jgi:hypothetical protein
MGRPDPTGDSAGSGTWRREDSAVFHFGDRHIDLESGRVSLAYRLDGIELVECFRVPVADGSPACPQALDAALDLLHWIAGVSYWKAGCPARIVFEYRSPDAWQAAWLERLYAEGLAEFAWRNGLDSAHRARFEGDAATAPAAVRCSLPARSLVPMGGGKDSLVALERLRDAGEALSTAQVGQAALIGEVARAAGTEHRIIERRVDPGLGELNAAGAWNGHVPVTAINAAALTLTALVAGYDRVVFANERSADEATLHDDEGRAVNHQFSKSLAFESMFSDWLARYVTPDLRVYSILRADRELAVCREFAGLTRYHGAFSSCNRNFHLDGARTDRWCGHCPKCHFVFLALAPFMRPDALAAIFGANLLDDRSQVDGFRALLGLEGHKPFECVGKADEARAALKALSREPAWRDSVVVESLAPLLEGLDVPALEALCRPGDSPCMPEQRGER